MSDTKRFAQFFIEMMEQEIYLPPSQFEAWFVSLAHTQKDLDKTIEACDVAFKKIWSLNDLDALVRAITIPISVGYTYLSSLQD